MNFQTRFSSWDKYLTDKRQGEQQTDRQAGWQVCLDKAIGFCQRRDLTATGRSEEVSVGEELRALSSRPRQSTLH